MDPQSEDKDRFAHLSTTGSTPLDPTAVPEFAHQLSPDNLDSPASQMASFFGLTQRFDDPAYTSYSEAAATHMDAVGYAAASSNQMLSVLSPSASNPGYHGYLLPHLFSGRGSLHDNSDAQSLHLLYSDALLMPASPFQDAASHFSEAFSNTAADHTHSNNLSGGLDHGFVEPSARRVSDAFVEEIMLGESVLTTNLNAMGYAGYTDSAHQRYGSGYANLDYANPGLSSPGLSDAGLSGSYANAGYANPPSSNYTSPGYSNPVIVVPGDGDGELLFARASRLTEDNLMNYNESYLQQPTPKRHNDVTISIHPTPDAIAERTPSLFSKSSHSSVNELPDADDGTVPNGRGVLPRSPARSPVSATGDNWLLNPDEFNSTRRGRQKAHSLKVRSRSALRLNVSDYSDADGEVTAEARDKNHLREKMLELASVGLALNRVQKHPSLYACHLCEKRFTRPYNLKSHLRTHTDERPFICGVCGKAFARQHDRKRHEDLHLGKKKFQCKGTLKDGSPYGCGRKFARADALRRHFQTESGKECIRLLVEEAEREHGPGKPQGIQLPDGEFMSAAELAGGVPIPQVAILPPQ